MTSNTATHRARDQDGSPCRRLIRAIAAAMRAIRRRPARTALLASIIGPPLVSLLLDVFGDGGDILIAAAVSLMLLTLTRVVIIMKRERSLPSTLAAIGAAGTALMRRTKRRKSRRLKKRSQ